MTTDFDTREAAKAAVAAFFGGVTTGLADDEVSRIAEAARQDPAEGPEWLPYYKAALQRLAECVGVLRASILHHGGSDRAVREGARLWYHHLLLAGVGPRREPELVRAIEKSAAEAMADFQGADNLAVVAEPSRQAADDVATLVARVLELDATASKGPWFFDSYCRVKSEPGVAARREWSKANFDDDGKPLQQPPDWKALAAAEPQSLVCRVPCVAGDTATRQGSADADLCAEYRTACPALAREVLRLRALVSGRAESVANLQAAGPGDDARMASEEWLKSVGFAGREDGLYFDRPICEEIGWTCFLRIDADSWEASVMECSVSDDEATGIVLPRSPVKTRGDVRRLCAALGVTLTEKQA